MLRRFQDWDEMSGSTEMQDASSYRSPRPNQSVSRVVNDLVSNAPTPSSAVSHALVTDLRRANTRWIEGILEQMSISPLSRRAAGGAPGGRLQPEKQDPNNTLPSHSRCVATRLSLVANCSISPLSHHVCTVTSLPPRDLTFGLDRGVGMARCDPR